MGELTAVNLDKILSRKTYIKVRIDYKRVIDTLKKEEKTLKKLIGDKKRLLEIAKEKHLTKIKIIKNLDEIKKDLIKLYDLILYTSDEDIATLIVKERRKDFVKEAIEESKNLGVETKFLKKVEKEVINTQNEKTTIRDKEKKESNENNNLIKKEEEIINSLEEEIRKLEEELKQIENL